MVQYPFREQRMATPMPESLPSLAEDVVTELVDVFRGTYALWGHSMGSVVAYEVARLCQQRPHTPPLVFFSSGSAAPCDSTFTGVAEIDTPDGLDRILRYYGGLGEQHLRDPAFMRYFAPIISADLRLLGAYEESTFERLRCPVVLMEGREDRVRIDGWQRYSDRSVEVAEFDGGHFFVEDRAGELAALMESRIQLLWQTRSAPVDQLGPEERVLHVGQ